jgi:hypothetical protein
MHVFVLESLKATDPRTGKAIHRYLDKQGIGNTYLQFASKQVLFEILAKVKNTVAISGELPFVHFDCHGNNDGIAVITDGKKGELVTWAEILELFIDIYKTSKQGLVVCMSSCNGFHISRMVAMGKACPFDQLCGSLKKISFNKSMEAYKFFYKNVADGMPVFDAAIAIHHAAGLTELEFLSANKYSLWNLMVKGYERDHMTAQGIAAQKAKLLAALKAEFPEPNPAQLRWIDEACSIAGLQAIISDRERMFFSL